MLRWALGFLVVAVIAAMLGYGGAAETSAGIAKVLFVVFLAGFVIIRLYRPTWIQAAKDTLLLPVAFVLFSIIVVVGLVKGWWYGGTVWKGRVVRTQRGLPPWKHGQRSKSC